MGKKILFTDKIRPVLKIFSLISFLDIHLKLKGQWLLRVLMSDRVNDIYGLFVMKRLQVGNISRSLM